MLRALSHRYDLRMRSSDVILQSRVSSDQSDTSPKHILRVVRLGQHEEYSAQVRPSNGEAIPR